MLVKQGQQVKKGQIIARVGNTGRSTGPHTHYMVKVNGVLKNPADFLN
jgi:murein DD-endopeptidase MepM/ murein hydrolase activator NlpD